MRSTISGIQIPTAARLNIDGEFTLDSLAGTSGHMLVSQGAGNTPAWSNTLTSPTIDIINAASSSSTTADIFGNVTTGTAGFADGLTTGTVNIATAATTLTGRTVNINTNATGNITVTTNIGSSVIGGTVKLTAGLAGVVLDTTLLKTPDVTSAASNALTIRTGTTTTSGNSGSLTIDTGSAAGTAGTISIGTTTQSGITIGRSGIANTVNGNTSFGSGIAISAGTSSRAPIALSSGTNLTTASAGALEYDGTAFYATPNATTGRAVNVASYYYVSDGSYSVDHSASSSAKSIFGGASTGLVLIAGTTYEVELNVYTSVTVVGVASPTWSHSFLLTTVSGTPTTTIYQQISTSSNTTSFATASTVSTLRNINNATVSVLASIASGSRYSIYTVKGIIRVTGTGSVEISPAATASATSPDYSFNAAAGSYIKITPIGNGTVTGVGTWA